MGSRGQAARVATEARQRRIERMTQAWALYCTPGGPTQAEIAEQLGVSRKTVASYIAEMKGRVEEDVDAFGDAQLRQGVAYSLAITERAFQRFLIAEDPQEARHWAAIVKDERGWQTKIFGWASPTRVEVTEREITDEDLALVRAEATQQEAERLRTDAEGRRALFVEILERARLKRAARRKASSPAEGAS